MAQSRLEKIGTIYSRTTSLIRSGAVKNKPLWYDVYELFPPKYEPRWDRLPSVESMKNADRKILYEEDGVRAKFYRHFEEGGLNETHDLFDRDFKPVSETFIEKYRVAEGEDDKSRFLQAIDSLELKDGIRLKKTYIEKKHPSPAKPSQVSMRDLFLERQKDKDN